MSPATRTSLARFCCEIALFTSLAIAATYPLVMMSATHIPQGSERTGSVPLLNFWTIWWNVDRIEHGYRNYWNAPIYRPVEGMLAGTEPQSIVGWLAWPLWRLTPAGQAQTYNILVVLFLTLNGWVACRVLRHLRLPWGQALVGGTLVSLLPVVHWQLGVFQLISVWGVLWTFIALLRFRRRPGCGSALHLAVAFAAVYSLCCYFGLFLSILLLVGSPLLFGRRLFKVRTWVWGAVAVASSAVLLSPVVSAQLSLAARQPFDYPQQWILDLSARPLDYLRPPGWQLVRLPELDDANGYPWPLCPGTLKMGVAGLGVVLGLLNRRRRRFVLFCTVIGLVAVLLSLGPRLEMGGFSVYRLLVDYFPGYGHVRSLLRFAFFFQIAVAMLAVIGLYECALIARRQLGHSWRQRTPIIALVLGIVLAAEAWPTRPGMYELPANAARQNWIAWLGDSARADACLVFFPLPRGYAEEDLLPTAVWMYYQTLHHRPMVNGYCTFVPEHFLRLSKKSEGFPTRTGIEALQASGVTHIVFDFTAGAVVPANELQAFGLSRVFYDRDAGMEIWRMP